MLCKHEVQKKFYSFALEKIKDCTGIVVGLSGGSDSVVLTRLLHSYCKEQSIPLYALHVNHMIRGEEADRDEAFCLSLCASLDIPFHAKHINVPEAARTLGTGIEETARNLRYDALYSLKDETGASHIALAHNSTDNLETVILNLTRGCGLTGICGIPPIRGCIVRPIIECSKAEIEDFAHTMGYRYVTDSTNSDTLYTRNKIRAEVLPILRSVNPSVEESCTKMSRTIRSDGDYLSDIALQYVHEDRVFVLAELDAPILSRVIKQKTDSDISFYHVTKITDLLKKCALQSGSRAYLSLPGSISAVIEDGRLSFRSDCKETADISPYNVKLSLGVNTLPYDCGIIYLCDKAYFLNNSAEYSALCEHYSLVDSAEIYRADPLFARTRKEKDTIKLGTFTKKVKKLMSEKKLSLSLRDSHPLICDTERILWIPLCAASDKIDESLKDGSENILKIFYFKERT